jgi:hypothetical protein
MTIERTGRFIFLLQSATYNTHRVSSDDGITVYAASNARPGRNNCSFTDYSAVKYYTICSYPDVVFDYDTTLRRAEALITNESRRVPAFVVGGGKCAVRSNQYAVTNLHAVARVNDNTSIDVTPLAYVHVARATGEFDLDETLYNHALIDCEHAAA